jgi:hypothetical protein
MASCAYHPKREAVGACVSCGKLVCAECKTVLGDKIYCNPCADKIFTSGVRAGTGVGIGAAAPPVENTSGQGGLAVFPAEIKGWNWGAFLLGWIWSIGNSVWIGLLALIPYLGFIMNIILGVKGSEWAWRYRRWDSIEHFKRTQSTWMKWGVGIVVGSIALTILIIIIAAIAES